MKHIHLLKTSSTNSYLKQLIASGKAIVDFTVVTTHEQTAGRGQRGNHWESNPGENITLSLLIRPQLGNATTYDLSIVAALATRNVVLYALENRAEVQVKWPNDILIGSRKIAGILIENEFSGSDIEYCIIGVGLNVAQELYEDYRPQATSISLERSRLGLVKTPTHLSAWHGELINAFVHEVERRLDQMSQDLDKLRAEYMEHLFWRGESGRLYRTADGKTFEGTLLDVEPTGMLRIQDDTTKEIQRFAFKEVQFVF